MANALRVGSVISLCSLRNTRPHLPLLSNATRFRSKFPFFTLSSSPNPSGYPPFRTLSSSSASTDEAVTTEAITSNNASGEAENSIKDAAGLLDIRVGCILRAWKHDEADSLYVEEVDIGEPEPRIICSGLVKYIPLEHLQGKKVIVLSNLKPRNMRGVKSCGMLMAASDAKHENVELLFPPEKAIPGERIWFGTEDEKDNQPDAATPNQLQKKKIWELVQPHLKTDASCIAMLGEHVMRSSVGSVACQSLQNANIS
ncbi:hypothetical protein GYH30_025886 [Glycine max]|nr:hypothetical protein GYH30_025886 [Glycine max]